MHVPFTAKCIGCCGTIHEARIVQIDFSAAVDMVNHLGIFFMLFFLKGEFYLYLYEILKAHRQLETNQEPQMGLLCTS